MKITLIGCGVFGSSLAKRFGRSNKVICYSNNVLDKDKLDIIDNKNISFSTDIEECVKDTSIIILCLPSMYVKECSLLISKYYNGCPVLVASKGIDIDNKLLVDVVKECIPNSKIGVLSGPTFASDIKELDQVIGFTLASLDNDVIECGKYLESDITKIEVSSDIIGVSICGVIKNVIAVASGILDGMGLSDSTRAFYLINEVNNIKNIIVSLGGNKDTILSYAGIGDFYMTTLSKNSRNYSYGKLIGEGKVIEAKEYILCNTVEGVISLSNLISYLSKYDINIDNLYNIDSVLKGYKKSLL